MLDAIPMDMPPMTRPAQSMPRLMEAHWMMAPMTQRTQATCRANLREYLSAIKELPSEPTRLPAGIAAVMPPWA